MKRNTNLIARFFNKLRLTNLFVAFRFKINCDFAWHLYRDLGNNVGKTEDKQSFKLNLIETKSWPFKIHTKCNLSTRKKCFQFEQNSNEFHQIQFIIELKWIDWNANSTPIILYGRVCGLVSPVLGNRFTLFENEFPNLPFSIRFMVFCMIFFFNCNDAWAWHTSVECEQKSDGFGVTEAIHWHRLNGRYVFVALHWF